MKKKIRLFFNKLLLKVVYWCYWKIGNKSVQDAYDLMDVNLRSLKITYHKTLAAWNITKFCTEKLRIVAENNLKACIIILVELKTNKWIGTDRTDLQFLSEKVKEIAGSFTFYDDKTISFDGIITECDAKGADETLTRLFLLIKILLRQFDENFDILLS